MIKCLPTRKALSVKQSVNKKIIKLTKYLLTDCLLMECPSANCPGVDKNESSCAFIGLTFLPLPTVSDANQYRRQHLGRCHEEKKLSWHVDETHPLVTWCAGLVTKDSFRNIPCLYFSRSERKHETYFYILLMCSLFRK